MFPTKWQQHTNLGTIRAKRGQLWVWGGAAAVAVQQWWRAARGRSSPFLVFVTTAEGAEVDEPWLCRFEQPGLDRQFTYGSALSTFSLALEEVSRGLRPTPIAEVR
jgi:hypothetical protein